jgi:hypothetical protein
LLKSSFRALNAGTGRSNNNKAGRVDLRIAFMVRHTILPSRSRLTLRVDGQAQAGGPGKTRFKFRLGRTERQLSSRQRS